MMGRIAFLIKQHLAFHRGSACLLALSFGIGVGLPLAVDSLSHRLVALLGERAATTPLLVGARGSPFQLVFSTLYVKGEPPRSVSRADIAPLARLARGPFIPLACGFRASGAPVVGTTFAYFRWRGLEARSGTLPIRFGDAVAGARVARRLGLVPGCRLLTDGASPWDPGGALPLNLRVTGILNETASPDDDTILTAVESVWIMSGLGHGHRVEGSTVAPKNVETFVEVTEKNIDGFHFHGKQNEFPVTAFVLANPTTREATIVKGVANNSPTLMAVYPAAVIDSLLVWLFKAEYVMKTYSLLTTAAMLALVVIIALLLRAHRAREFDVLYRLGCTRGETTALWLGGVLVVLAASLVLAVAGERLAHVAFDLWWRSL